MVKDHIVPSHAFDCEASEMILETLSRWLMEKRQVAFDGHLTITGHFTTEAPPRCALGGVISPLFVRILIFAKYETSTAP